MLQAASFLPLSPKGSSASYSSRRTASVEAFSFDTAPTDQSFRFVTSIASEYQLGSLVTRSTHRNSCIRFAHPVSAGAITLTSDSNQQDTPTTEKSQTKELPQISFLVKERVKKKPRLQFDGTLKHSARQEAWVRHMRCLVAAQQLNIVWSEEIGWCQVPSTQTRSLSSPISRAVSTEAQDVATESVSLVWSERVVHIADLVQDTEKLYVVMEEIDGIDLHEASLRAVSLWKSSFPIFLLKVAQELAFCLRALENMGLVHRDIKLENVMMLARTGRGILTLIDLDTILPCEEELETAGGLSWVMSRRKLLSGSGTVSSSTVSTASSTKSTWFDTDILGTDMYIAPEVYAGHYSPKSDAFAVGVILFRMATGRFPFSGDMFDDERGENYVGHPGMEAIGSRLREACNQIAWDELGATEEVFVAHPAFLDLVRGLMKERPSERYSARQVLRHPALRKYGTCLVDCIWSDFCHKDGPIVAMQSRKGSARASGLSSEEEPAAGDRSGGNPTPTARGRLSATLGALYRRTKSIS